MITDRVRLVYCLLQCYVWNVSTDYKHDDHIYILQLQQLDYVEAVVQPVAAGLVSLVECVEREEVWLAALRLLRKIVS